MYAVLQIVNFVYNFVSYTNREPDRTFENVEKQFTERYDSAKMQPTKRGGTPIF